jgi:hypothetical protein
VSMQPFKIRAIGSHGFSMMGFLSTLQIEGMQENSPPIIDNLQRFE